MNIYAKRRFFGRVTQVADTVITRLIPPERGLFTTLADIWYICGGTAHALTVMRPLGKTYTTAAAAAAQAVINVARNPGTYSHFGTISTADNALAANDYCVYQTADGQYVVDTVASVSSLAITMTGNVPTAGVLAGAPFWFFGLTTDLNPANNTAHPVFTLTASATTKLGSDPGDTLVGALGSIAPPPETRKLTSTTYGRWPLNGREEPLIIHSNNATAAGTIERAIALYNLIG